MSVRKVRFYPRPGIRNWFRRKMAHYSVFGKEANRIYRLVQVCYKAYLYSKKSENQELAFNLYAFAVCQELKERGEPEIPLPGAWYLYGFTVDWPSLNDVIGKIGWGVDGPDALYGD